MEETLEGRTERLKGYGIAVSVFGRDETFDNSADPVVRLEARRLRRDLDSYYVDAGRSDPLRISIPKGGYVPTFEWQAGAARPDPVPVAVEPEPEGEPQPDEASAAAPRADEVDEPDTPPEVPPEAPLPVRRRDGGRRYPVAIMAGAVAASLIGLCVLAVLTVAVWSLWQETARTEASAGVGEPAVVVLPFRSLGGAQDGPFLAAGISQELIDHLMRFPSLRVYMRPVSVDVDGGHGALVQAGRDLGVAYVISGTVGVEGETARIGVQLYDARTGQVIWSASYDRPLVPAALMDLQRDLAGEIASVLAQPYGVVSRDVGNRLAATQFDASMASYVCVLRAYIYRRSFSNKAFPPVFSCLQAAVQRDPDYPDALAMLGWLYLDAGRFEFLKGLPQAEAYERAYTAASKAVALDPHNVLALKALGSINHYMGRYAEGERLSREAVALNPSDPDALAQLGWRLAVRGRFDEGIPLLERAIARSVDPPVWYNHLISIDHFMNGRYQEMLEISQGSVADGIGISEALVAIAAGELGEPDIAREALAKMAGYGPLIRDPAAYFRRHGATDEIVEALTAGLEQARRVAAGS
ncbi:hypothetical protein DLJ53_17765 [Acuticoccus sediminis]|uniref:TolB-like protein n=1 Tax=Acuticoccus sediminis TaxID=2184697 RepID=A0A8B2NUB0_9HYPH|nr:tetratricopeptide repeat protein [Acuticoccus sediminis]RAI01064.1 hypothetical protein DLJ53_17765 [Acuticoccus sediminis]